MGGTAAKAILTPWRLRRGYGKGSWFCFGFFFFFPGVGLYFFSSRSEAGDSWFGSHSRRGGRSGRSGGGPGVWLRSGWEQMAPDPRVPAAAAAPRERPASVRSGGWTRRAEGASIHPPTPPGLWLLSAREWSPSLQFFWRVILGRIMGGRHRISKQHSLDCGKGSGAIAPLTLKRGKDIPHLSFSSVKWKLRKTHSFLRLSLSSQGLPWESDRPVGRRPFSIFPHDRGKNLLLSEL